MLHDAPFERRNDLAERALSHAKAQETSEWAQECIADSDQPLGPDLANTLAAAAASAPESVSMRGDVSKTSDEPRLWTPWFANVNQGDAVKRVCEALIPSGASTLAGDLQSDLMDASATTPAATPSATIALDSLVAVADGLSILGNADRADSLALIAIDRLRAEPPASPVEEINADARRSDGGGEGPSSGVEGGAGAAVGGGTVQRGRGLN